MRRCTVCGWMTLVGGLVVVPQATGQLPDGPGKTETQQLCSQCHAVEVATSVRHDRAGWAATLQKMTALGAKGTPEELDTVLEYLVTHFRSSEVARINVNTATAIELESGLTLRRSQARAIIAYRSQRGPFKSFADLRSVPGLEAGTLEAKKDRIAF